MRSDKSIFINQGEWELLEVFPQFKEFSIDISNSYAEMKFYVSGCGCGWGRDKNAWGSTVKQTGKDIAAPLPTPGPYTFHATLARVTGTQQKYPLFILNCHRPGARGRIGVCHSPSPSNPGWKFYKRRVWV